MANDGLALAPASCSWNRREARDLDRTRRVGFGTPSNLGSHPDCCFLVVQLRANCLQGEV